MILYALKSVIGLSVLLLFYQLVLEKQPLHVVKRVYLLASVLFALLGPLLSFDLTVEVLPVPDDRSVNTTSIEQVPAPSAPTIRRHADVTATDWSDVLLIGYGLVVALMLGRMGYNLYTLLRRVHRHPTRLDSGATLVLLLGPCLPHAFLHYLFISQTDYEQGSIQPEVFTHEYAHIRQRHTLDLLFLELTLCLLWFNPALWLLGRAMRLNHEFLADAAVNRRYGNLVTYQQLLLRRVEPQPTTAFTNTLFFHPLKQRFIMMTRQTSPVRTLTTAGLSIAVFALITLLAGAQLSAQSTPAPAPAAAPKQTAKPQTQPVPASLAQRYSDKLVITWSRQRKMVRKKFSELSPEEQQRVILIPPQKAQTPTEKQFADWKNPKMFGIWIDDKHVKNSVLNQYKAADIASFWGSYVHKNARQPQGYKYQMDLMTHKAYAKYLQEEADAPMLMLEGTEWGKRK